MVWMSDKLICLTLEKYKSDYALPKLNACKITSSKNIHPTMNCLILCSHISLLPVYKEFSARHCTRNWRELIWSVLCHLIDLLTWSYFLSGDIQMATDTFTDFRCILYDTVFLIERVVLLNTLACSIMKFRRLFTIRNELGNYVKRFQTNIRILDCLGILLETFYELTNEYIQIITVNNRSNHKRF